MAVSHTSDLCMARDRVALFISGEDERDDQQLSIDISDTPPAFDAAVNFNNFN